MTHRDAGQDRPVLNLVDGNKNVYRVKVTQEKSNAPSRDELWKKSSRKATQKENSEVKYSKTHESGLASKRLAPFLREALLIEGGSPVAFPNHLLRLPTLFVKPRTASPADTV